MQATFCFIWALAASLLFLTAFLCSEILVIDIAPHSSGMGNHLFRYAAGMGLVERGFDVCWFNYSMDQLQTVQHEHSFFLNHVYDPHVVPECSMLTGVLATMVLPRHTPPFSKYMPFQRTGFATLMNGPMESFRYFPKNGPTPLYRLRQGPAAERWMRDRNLTSAVHVRRGDYIDQTATLEYYNNTRVTQAVVVTDDRDWVQRHPEVFGAMTMSEYSKVSFTQFRVEAGNLRRGIELGAF